MDLKESERLFQNRIYSLFSEKGRTDPVGNNIVTVHELNICRYPVHILRPFQVFPYSNNGIFSRQSSEKSSAIFFTSSAASINTLAITGSKCVPAPSSIIFMASSKVKGFL